MASEPELDEKDFIQEKNPKTIWVFLILFLVFIALMWGIGMWQRSLAQEKLKESPFFQVTNREFSLFLWQNPQYMRAHANLPDAYLPHFHSQNEVNVIPEFADEYVAAPRDILYRYHAWKRLIGNYVSDRPIYKEHFQTFLNANPEWLPELWKQAPPAYAKLVGRLDELSISNLQTLPYNELPLEVRMAYVGWLNYTRERGEIDRFNPSKEELSRFLEVHPHYARNYWRNLYPDYLLNREGDAPLKESDFTWFLKSAAFNFLQQNRLDR